MNDLRLALDDTDFDTLLETARSLIPTLAPQWTDHNLHDPGIMLAELLAWTAEAQIYALGRTRRDERLAYAALTGVRPRGPVPARGLVWPPQGDAAAAHRGELIPALAPLTSDRPDAPRFRTTVAVLRCGVLQALRSRHADGQAQDWTRSSGQAGVSFSPFSDPPHPAEQLELVLAKPLPAASGPGRVSIGFEIEPPAADGTAAGEPAEAPEGEPGVESGDEAQAGNRGSSPDPNGAKPACTARRPERLRVWLADAAPDRDGLPGAPWLRQELEVVGDTTAGLLRSGVLLLVPPPHEVSGATVLVLRSRGGPLLRAPRLRRVALDVLPVEQAEAVSEEDPWFGTGQPDRRHTLRRPGLMNDGTLTVQSVGPGGAKAWTRVQALGAQAPEAPVFTLDPAAGTLEFGNGINGAVFPEGASLQVDYTVSAGAQGNLPAGARWSVAGFSGVYGDNAEPLGGGFARDDLARLRLRARRRLAMLHPLVTPADLEQAALALEELGIARAHELPAAALAGEGPRGLRVLVAVGRHGTAGVEEPPRWLDEIAARLAPRLPLGQRLRVVGPRYVTLGVRATLVALPRNDPARVAQAAADALQARLAPVALAGMAAADAPPAWPLGREVPLLSLKGWLRRVPGVAQVQQVWLSADGAEQTRAAPLGRTGLPRLQVAARDITVARPALGSTA